MKREIALPAIAVSILVVACKDTVAPVTERPQVVASVATGTASLIADVSMKNVEVAALDAATRLTRSMTDTPDVMALRRALTDISDFAAAGDKTEALSSASAASQLLSKLDPANRNPDAAAIRLVINGARNQLSR